MNKVSLKVEVQSKASEYSLQYCIGKYLEEAGFDNVVVEPLKAQKPGWISVKDRLPENELMVIGYTPVDGYMFIGFHRTEVAFGWSSWYIITSMRSTKKITKKVTHWMPLPEPPKEGKHDQPGSY